jgi:hypothetical protein
MKRAFNTIQRTQRVSARCFDRCMTQSLFYAFREIQRDAPSFKRTSREDKLGRSSSRDHMSAKRKRSVVPYELRNWHSALAFYPSLPPVIAPIRRLTSLSLSLSLSPYPFCVLFLCFATGLRNGQIPISSLCAAIS